MANSIKPGPVRFVKEHLVLDHFVTILLCVIFLVFIKVEGKVPTAEEVEWNDSSRPNVNFRVVVVATEDFWRHVGHCAHLLSIGFRRGKTETCDPDVAPLQGIIKVLNKDVFRLEVTMHDALRVMQVIQGLHQRQEGLHKSLLRESLLILILKIDALEIAALAQLYHWVELLISF